MSGGKQHSRFLYANAIFTNFQIMKTAFYYFDDNGNGIPFNDIHHALRLVGVEEGDAKHAVRTLSQTGVGLGALTYQQFKNQVDEVCQHPSP